MSIMNTVKAPSRENFHPISRPMPVSELVTRTRLSFNPLSFISVLKFVCYALLLNIPVSYKICQIIVCWHTVKKVFGGASLKSRNVLVLI